MSDSYPILMLKPGTHNRIRNGHPWAFKDELMPHEPLEAGVIVQLHTDYDYDIGLGFYHPTSQIAIRLLRVKQGLIDTSFFIDRLSIALALRDRLFPHEPIYRLCFGESDGLPGLIIDRYGDYCALQLLSAGMDKKRQEIVEALQSIIPTLKGIIAKNDSQLRVKEGLEKSEEVLWGTIPDNISITENGIALSISLIQGQKTGYYLDQRLNRSFVSKISKDLTVLDCFTNQGGFALHAAFGGASKVLGIDSAKSAIDASIVNAQLNNYHQCSFIQADVFDYIKKAAVDGDKWDIVILDPPAFTKSKATLSKAKRGYAEINRQALKLIHTGGFLVTASCSQLFSEAMLIDCVQQEAKRINRQISLIYKGGQSPCHPILPSMLETSYLKCLVFSVQ